jgi:CheY-like chemotaxis protein
MRPRDHSPLRVLVADDYPDTRATLRLLLASWGHEAREAADGAEALRVDEEFQPDVVLLDLAMPGTDGCDVARGLRGSGTTSRPLPVALTAHTRPRHVQAALEAGFDRFLAKPCDPSQIDFLLRSCARGGWETAARPADSHGRPGSWQRQ